MKNQILKNDLKRYPKKIFYTFRLLKLFRYSQSSKGLLNYFYRFLYRKIALSHGIEISSSTKIGEGFYICHPYCININSEVTIGKNCNIHKGVTIGQENRGKRKGSPKIGDCVWIGVNATIVGNISIGNNVLIAPNTFVNCDVPSNSIVFGNPCIIKHSEKATKDYIVRQC